MRSRVADLFRGKLPEALLQERNPKKKRGRKPKKLETEPILPISQENPMKFNIHKKKRKQHIPLALREQVWIKHMGKVFQGKCPTTWCQNTITVYDFQSGHDIPESKGGPTTLENLIPLCSRCNNSMSNNYTFKQWCDLAPEKGKTYIVPVTVPESNESGCWCF